MQSIKISVLLMILFYYHMSEQNPNSKNRDQNDKQNVSTLWHKNNSKSVENLAKIRLRRKSFKDSFSTNFCDDPSIDAAVRVSDNDLMFVFKGEDYWVFDRIAKSLSAGKKIKTDFQNLSRDLVAVWVGEGFDAMSPTSGRIYILKDEIIYIYSVRFHSVVNYDIEFNKTLKETEFWGPNPPKGEILGVSQLNTWHGREGLTPRDLIVLIDNSYGVLYTTNDQELIYNWVVTEKAKSEKGSNRLSCFDLKTHESDYWKGRDSEPISNVLNITALVFYPNGVVVAIGKQEFCNINIDSLQLNVTCTKQSVRQLFCPTSGTTNTITSSDSEVQSTGSVATSTATNDITQSPFMTKRSSPIPEGESQNSDDSSNVGFYIFGAIVVLFVIIAIVALVGYLFISKKSSKRSSKSSKVTDEPLTEGPIDPRYGQIDSSLNLSLRIANPSNAALDQQMAEQNDEIKSESESQKTNRKAMKK